MMDHMDDHHDPKESGLRGTPVWWAAELRYEVSLHKLRKQLGVDVLDKSLRIQHVYGGIIFQHNRDYPETEVREGDKIIMCNGQTVTSKAEFRKAFRSDPAWVTLGFSRPTRGLPTQPDLGELFMAGVKRRIVKARHKRDSDVDLSVCLSVWRCVPISSA